MRFESVRDIEMIRQRTSTTTTIMFLETLDKYPLGRGLGTGSQPSRHLLGEGSSEYAMIENYPSKIQMETGIMGVLFFYMFLLTLSIRWYRGWHRILNGPFLDLTAPITAYCLTQFVIAGLFGSLDSVPQSVFLWAFVGFVARMFVLSKTIQQKVYTKA